MEYTMFYCLTHQETFLLEGIYNTIPESFFMCGRKCQELDWYIIGEIHIDTYGFIHDSIPLKYNRKATYIYSLDGTQTPISVSNLAFWHSDL